MTRHTFRWEGLVFGLFFLAAVGAWAVWNQDVLTTRELTLLGSGVLILLGALGVGATLVQSRPRAATPTTPESTTLPEGPEDEEADPKP